MFQAVTAAEPRPRMSPAFWFSGPEIMTAMAEAVSGTRAVRVTAMLSGRVSRWGVLRARRRRRWRRV